MAIVSTAVVLDLATRTIYAGRIPTFFRGDTIHMSVSCVTSVAGGYFAPPTAFPSGAVLQVGFGSIGATGPAISVIFSTTSSDFFTKSGAIPMGYVPTDTFLGSSTSKAAVLEFQITEADSTVTTIEGACLISDDVLKTDEVDPGTVDTFIAGLAAETAARIAADSALSTRVDAIEGSDANLPTADEKAAMDAANSPSGTNPFATENDVLPPASSSDVIALTSAALAVTPFSLVSSDGNIRWAFGKTYADGPAGPDQNYYVTDMTGIRWNGPDGAGGLSLGGVSPGVYLIGTSGALALLSCGASPGWLSSGPLYLGSGLDGSGPGVAIDGTTGFVKVYGPPPGIADSNTLVRGDDLRFLPKGGVQFSTQASSVESSVSGSYNFNSKWTILSMVYGRTFGAGNGGLWDSNDGGLAMYTTGSSGDLAIVRSNQALLNTIAGAFPSTHPIYGAAPGWLEATYDGTTLSFSYSGVSGASAAINLSTLTKQPWRHYGGYTTGVFAATLRQSYVFNRVLTSSEIAACEQGQVPVGIAGQGAVSQTSGALFIGREYRITSVAGSASFTSVGASANTVGVTFTATGTTPTWGTGSVESIGIVEHYAPDHVTASGNWVGTFGSVLRSGGTITPLNPVSSISNVIIGSVSGATLTAGAAPATIGTFTTSDSRSASALAGTLAWDAVSASWGQARPTNATAVIATATAAGVITLESTAIGSNATVAAATAVKITRTIN